jgi:hypothetical protein
VKHSQILQSQFASFATLALLMLKHARISPLIISFVQLVGSKILENETAMMKKSRWKFSKSSEGVQNLIKDHGCMKSFFNISRKNQVPEKVKCRREQRQHKFLRLNIIYSGVDYKQRETEGVGEGKFPEQHSTRCGSSIKVLCDKLKKASSREFLPLLKRSKVVEGEKSKSERRRQETFQTFSLPSKLSEGKFSLGFFSLCAFGGRRKEEKLILNRYRNGLLKAAKDFIDLSLSGAFSSFFDLILSRKTRGGNVMLNKYLPLVIIVYKLTLIRSSLQACVEE